MNYREILEKSLLPYLEENKETLTKNQLYDIFTEYAHSVYMLNGHTHIRATVEMVFNLERKDADEEL